MQTKGFSNTAIPGNFALELKGINYHLGFYYANASLNLVFTLVIAGRIWWVARQINRLLGREDTIKKKYRQIIVILIECGIIYPITLIAHAAVEGNNNRIVIPVSLT
ncbi:hypothetical protein GYMLUDRAFT_143625, partial [Collybiopsis luxurians FD-317 M1]